MTTITGGIIVKEDSSIHYKMKCEKCGTVGTSESSVGKVGHGATSPTYTQRCSKCGNTQKIIIKG